MDTERLIQTLVDTAKPVRPLPRPWVRSVFWLAIAIPYMALVVYVMSPRADLMVKLAETSFSSSSLPRWHRNCRGHRSVCDYNSRHCRKALLLPLRRLRFGSALLDRAVSALLIQFGPNGLSLQPDWFCFPAIVLVGAIPAVAMVVMLRRGAPLMPAPRSRWAHWRRQVSEISGCGCSTRRMQA